jgi:hypothetical protein
MKWKAKFQRTTDKLKTARSAESMLRMMFVDEEKLSQATGEFLHLFESRNAAMRGKGTQLFVTIAMTIVNADWEH